MATIDMRLALYTSLLDRFRELSDVTDLDGEDDYMIWFSEFKRLQKDVKEALEEQEHG